MFGKNNITKATDEELMLLTGKGNTNAFEQLYARYFDKLVWYAFGLTDNMEKSRDVVQDVFIRIIEKSHQFDRQRKFSTWVYTVTGNACKNLVRDEQNRDRLLQHHAAGSMDAAVLAHPRTDYRLLQRRISELLDELSEKERKIYLLRFEQELSIKEIAAIADIPEGSVKSCIFYLLKKFGHRLKEFTHG